MNYYRDDTELRVAFFFCFFGFDKVILQGEQNMSTEGCYSSQQKNVGCVPLTQRNSGIVPLSVFLLDCFLQNL